MDRVLSSELASQVGERVRVAGWLHHQRQLAKVSFLLVRDRAGIAQVVAIDVDVRGAVAELLAETVVEITGKVIVSDQAPSGVEIVNPEVTVLASPTDLSKMRTVRLVVRSTRFADTAQLRLFPTGDTTRSSPTAPTSTLLKPTPFTGTTLSSNSPSATSKPAAPNTSRRATTRRTPPGSAAP